MDPRKLSELEPFLRINELAPKKSLSQNFLIDANVLRKIVKVADVKENEAVLEIGPGPGALTKTLIEANANVVAIEIDKNYAGRLQETINDPRLKVECLDFLKFQPKQIFKICANIPYHISTDIVEKIAENREYFSSAFLTVQKDFAERILCKKPYNAFSLFVELFFDAKISFTISKDCFYPKPKVPSALLSLITKKELPVEDPFELVNFIRFLFKKRRKMIRSILEMPELGDQRPESMSLEKITELYKFLKKIDKLPQKE